MTEWKIQPRSNACQSCGKGFADKGLYYTLLFDKRHNLDRLDVCPECWTGQYSQGANDRKGFVSFWQGVFNVPPPPAPEPIQKESAETLLRKLVEMNDPQYQGACFILGVMLERKRMFKVKTQGFEDGKRILYYEHIRTGDLFTIADPGLQLRQLEAVQHQVTELLKHGFSDGGAEVPAAAVRPETAGDLAMPSESGPPVNGSAEPPPQPAVEPSAKTDPGAGGESAEEVGTDDVAETAPEQGQQLFTAGLGTAKKDGETPVAV